MSGRCKACDCVLSDSEIIWKPALNCFEDLCKKCRGIISRDLQTDNDHGNLENGEDGNLVYLEDIK